MINPEVVEKNNNDWGDHNQNDLLSGLRDLTLTRPMGLPPHAPVAQKIADQRWLIANSAKKGTFLYKMMWIKVD